MIYFIRGTYSKRIKIGYSIDILSRIKELRTGSPDELKVIGYFFGNQTDEKKLHKKFKKYSLHGEWFEENQELIRYIEENCIGGEPIPIEKFGEEFRIYYPYPYLIKDANILNLGGFHLKALTDKNQKYIVGFQGSEKNILRWLDENGVLGGVLDEFSEIFRSMNDRSKSVDTDDPVYLIASGYEWTCPHCEHLNREIEIPKQVVCSRCRRAYPVAEADHVWG